MGFYDDQVVPRVVDRLLGGRAVDEVRARVCRNLSGEVLEIGFGSGRNLPLMPSGVTTVFAVDPSETGRRLASDRIAASPIDVVWVGDGGEQLSLEDDSVDHALSTWTLCTIPDVGAALAEVRRVLRPEGRFHFVEHGLSPDARTARRQRRLTPLQRRLAGGCHLDRPIDELLEDAGFRIERLDTYLGAWPPSFGWFYEGRAAPSP